MSFLDRAEEAFPGKGQLILDVIDGTTNPETYDSVNAWVRQCFNRPEAIEMKMCAINEIIEGHGVEALFWADEIHPDMEYVNMGDTYATTIVYNYIDNLYRVIPQGDWIEHAEQQGRIYP